MEKEYCISEKVIIQIEERLSSYAYETGGILGVKNGMIDIFIFDEGIPIEDKNEYIPNITILNETLKKWKKERIGFVGLVHSHISTTSLSFADISFARKILFVNELDWIFMPIYVLACQSLIWFMVTKQEVYKLLIKGGFIMDKEKVVTLPEGKCCGYCCGDCIYMDLYSKNKYDEAYCGKYGKYYPPSSSASSCSYFSEK